MSMTPAGPLGLREAARRLNTGTAQVREYIESGDLTGIRLYGTLKVCGRSVRALRAAHVAPIKQTGVYIIRAEELNRYKIGYATDLKKRLSMMQVGSPVELTLVGFFEGRSMVYERKLQRRFRKTRLRGEWFTESPELLALCNVEKGNQEDPKVPVVTPVCDPRPNFEG